MVCRRVCYLRQILETPGYRRFELDSAPCFRETCTIASSCRANCYRCRLKQILPIVLEDNRVLDLIADLTSDARIIVAFGLCLQSQAQMLSVTHVDGG
jgi:hypothetical protein